MRIQKLLRVKIAGFAPVGVNKLTDAKAKEAAAEKQKMAFMTWTNDVNKRAAFKDYLATPEDRTQSPAPDEQVPPLPSPAPAAPKK